MRPELQQRLIDKYPKIFQEVGLPATKSRMADGIVVDDGWYWLIDKLCLSLQADIDNNGQPQIVATQIKEKFGGLRFYTRYASIRQQAMIDLAEAFSLSICENCGDFQTARLRRGSWMKTYCDACAPAENFSREISANITYRDGVTELFTSKVDTSRNMDKLLRSLPPEQRKVMKDMLDMFKEEDK